MDNKFFRNEKWKEINFEINLPHPKYEISNYGRVKSYAIDKVNGQIISGSTVKGYKSLMVKFGGGFIQSYYIHRLVAQAFLPKTKKDMHYVVHNDYDKANNHVSNLRWVTEEERYKHNNENPRVKIKRTTGYKLTENDVRVIKKLLRNNKTRLSMIAKRFKITHTQLNRIRSGENWGHVTI